MGIERKAQWEAMVGALQQQLPPDDLGVRLTGAQGETLAVTRDGASYEEGPVILNEREALVTCAEGTQLFRFDSAGTVVGSRFVDRDGNEREMPLGDRLSQDNFRMVAAALEHSLELFACLDRCTVKGLFEEE